MKNKSLEIIDLLSALYHKKEKLRENCSYSEFFWSVFSHIWTEYGDIRSIKSECGKMQTRKSPNTDNFYASKRSSKSREDDG